MIRRARGELHQPPEFETAACVLRGGPADGGGSDRVPMVVPGLAPDYIEVALGGESGDESIAVYRRVTACAQAWATREPVWHYDYDVEATRDPRVIERR